MHRSTVLVTTVAVLLVGCAAESDDAESDDAKPTALATPTSASEPTATNEVPATPASPSPPTSPSPSPVPSPSASGSLDTEDSPGEDPRLKTFYTDIDEFGDRPDYLVFEDEQNRIILLEHSYPNDFTEREGFAFFELNDLPTDARMIDEFESECPLRVYVSDAVPGYIEVSYIPPLEDEPVRMLAMRNPDRPTEATDC